MSEAKMLIGESSNVLFCLISPKVDSLQSYETQNSLSCQTETTSIQSNIN